MKEIIQQIKLLKDSRSRRFDPDKLTQLYRLIDKLYIAKTTKIG